MNAYIIDTRGVYIKTEIVDPLGPQPSGAVYETPPEEEVGKAIVWKDKGWVLVNEEGLEPIFVPEVVKVIPAEVTMAQCRLALFDKHGIETDEEFYGLVDILPEDSRVRARLELRTRPTVRYDNPLVIAFCNAMEWDRDELFIYADTL